MGPIAAGGSFGEYSLFSDKPRTATVFAKTASIAVATLSKQDYLKIIGDNFKNNIAQAVVVYQKFELFRNMSK